MQLAMHLVTIEDLMPKVHFLRKLEAALDLSFVYEETDHLYTNIAIVLLSACSFLLLWNLGIS